MFARHVCRADAKKGTGCFFRFLKKDACPLFGFFIDRLKVYHRLF
jgi:hypothetical protein